MKLSVRWSVRLGMLVLPMLARTWRVRVSGDAVWKAQRASGTPILLSLWHGDLLPLVWAHRGQTIVVAVSEHRDGEVIAQILERFGFGTTRGSSTRGGSRALLGLIRTLEKNDIAAVTPDGPRGPRHSIQPGILAAARRAGANIVCIGVASSRAWHLSSWDRFHIPKPFARVAVAYADAVVVPREVSDLESVTPQLAAAMDIAHQRALDALARG